MANVIYIQDNPDSPGAFKVKGVKVFPILDTEIQINYETEFASLGEMVPSINDMVNLAGNVLSLGGKAGTGMLNIKNMLSVPKWQWTKPPRVNVKLHFYTKNDPEKDVALNMQDLINLYIITKSKSGKAFDVPGISLSSIKMGRESSQNKQDLSTQGKFCAIKIPGMIFMPVCMVTQAVPTFSNERTESGYPLWGILDIEFTSLFPATSDTYDKFPVNSIESGNQGSKVQ